MQLKRYQERVIREVRSFLDLLAQEQQEDNRHATLDAWDRAKKLFALRGEYIPRKNGLGKDLPTFCFKVPTFAGQSCPPVPAGGRSGRGPQGDAKAKDWQDTLHQVLANYRV